MQCSIGFSLFVSVISRGLIMQTPTDQNFMYLKSALVDSVTDPAFVVKFATLTVDLLWILPLMSIGKIHS